MSIRDYYNKKRRQETNVILIVLGLLLIFIIGYAFWHTSKKDKTQISSPEKEPNQLEQLQKLLKQKVEDRDKALKDLEEQEVKRKQYFFYTRLLLVILTLSIFAGLQYYWKFELYQKCHVIDNLRNYLSLIVICFTTIAFISKGSLKSFKESIEDMAINWFFKSEETLRFEIQLRELEIASIKHHIQTLENDNT